MKQCTKLFRSLLLQLLEVARGNRGGGGGSRPSMKQCTKLFRSLLLQLLEVARAIGGQGVAPIHETMHEDAVHPALLGHAQQRIEMVLVRSEEHTSDLQ